MHLRLVRNEPREKDARSLATPMFWTVVILTLLAGLGLGLLLANPTVNKAVESGVRRAFSGVHLSQ